MSKTKKFVVGTAAARNRRNEREGEREETTHSTHTTVKLRLVVESMHSGHID